MIKKFIIESADNNQPSIQLTKDGKNYEVNYQITVDGELFEITGSMKRYNTGRSNEYRFEPDWYSSKECENWFDENWENVESELIAKT